MLRIAKYNDSGDRRRNQISISQLKTNFASYRFTHDVSLVQQLLHGCYMCYYILATASDGNYIIQNVTYIEIVFLPYVIIRKL